MSGFSFYNSYNSTGIETAASRRRRNAPRPQYQPLSSYRPDSASARDRRRRYFANVLNTTSPAAAVFGEWTRSPSGLYATGRISRTNRPVQPGRPQMRGQRHVNPSSYNPSHWYSDNEYNPLRGSSHEHAQMTRTQRYHGPANRPSRSETAYNTGARHGQVAYNAVIRDQNQARYNPSFSNFFGDYNSARRYLDYQRGLRSGPISTSQFYGS